jgi:Protein of unknown function (DUF998)
MSSAFPFAVVSLIGTIAYVAAFVALHVLPTGYDPIHHAVSDYGVGPYSRWFTIGLWSSAVSVLALAVGLRIGVGSPPLADRDLVFLGLITLARVGMSAFPTNLEGERFTRTAVVHYVFAILAFTFTYLAISHLTSSLGVIKPWHSFAQPLHWLVGLVELALAAVVVTIFRPLRTVFGLFERIFLVTTNVWFLLVGALLVAKTG